MRFSQKWWVIVALLFAFALTVSVLTAQTEEPSAVNAPSSAKVQADSVGAQASSDEPEQKQPTLEPSRNAALATNVEIKHRFNELRSEFLDYQEKVTDRWLKATAIFLTLLGVAAAILGYFGFKRLDRIESEARENMEESEQHAEEAQRYVEDIKTMRNKIKVDSAVSEAISLQQQNRTYEAIEKWRSIANITEGTDDAYAANAWFFIGYLKSVKGEDFEAIVAYNKAIDLNLSGPNLPYAYFNLGNIKARLGQTASAIADYDVAIDLYSSDADFYIRRGEAKQRSGDSEGAMADYDMAIGLNPSNVPVYFKQGTIKIFSGRKDEARQYFEKARDLAREQDNSDLIAQAESMLESLDRGDAPEQPLPPNLPSRTS